MMIEANSEIKCVFPADVARSLWEKKRIAQEASTKMDERKSVRPFGLRFYAWENSTVKKM